MESSFDYQAALDRLIDLRFEARLRGTRQGEEIHSLEHEIYTWVWSNGSTSDDEQVEPAKLDS
ncbi:MAG TPA: hypothetical protein VE175_00125 [Woeseiaceae bacterium]|nr:hypothetical protein [Woeseiaceae bacterium]